MTCPKCGGRTRVYETRDREGVTVRRRQCLDHACGTKIRTEERPTRVETPRVQAVA